MTDEEIICEHIKHSFSRGELVPFDPISFARAIIAAHDAELRKQEPVCYAKSFGDFEPMLIDLSAALQAKLDAADARIELLEHDAKTGDYETLYAQVVVKLTEAERKCGDGTVPARFHWLMKELCKRFPIDELSSESPERRIFEAMDKRITEADRLNKVALERLEKIACLGNGDMHGNSTGNCMAIDAIKELEKP